MTSLFSQADSERAKISLDAPGASDLGQDLDAQTAFSYVRKNAWTQNVEGATAAAYRVISGAELGSMSALYMHTYAQAAGNFRVLIESSEDSAQGMKIKVSGA